MSFEKKSLGQVSLVALLLAAGAMVVVLSLVPRTVTEIKLSKQEEQAAQALYAAEAGVEQVLSEGVEVVGCDGSRSGELEEATYTATVSCLGGGTGVYVFENVLGQDETFQINFDSSSPPGRIRVWWVNQNNEARENGSSLEFTMICDDSGTYEALRDGVNSSGDGIAGFYAGNNVVDTREGVTFLYKKQMLLTCPSGTLKKLRIKSLFKETTLGIRALDGDSLPVLEYRIYSEGEITTENIVQAVEVTRPATAGLSSIFDYALFSGSSL